MNKVQLKSRRHFLKKIALGVGSASLLATLIKITIDAICNGNEY